MRRPLPTLPRGRGLGRRPAGAARAQPILLACSRVSPEWELGAIRVLMKPHEWTRGAIVHRSAEQPWGPRAVAAVERAMNAVLARLAPAPVPKLHFPQGGDYWFLVETTSEQLDVAKALGVVLSHRLPGTWLTMGRLYLRDGRFYRRKRDNTFKFRLLPAPSIHLPRGMRSSLRGLI